MRSHSLGTMRLAAAAAAILVVATCHAATLTVTNTADAGPGSLRWAIGQANTTPAVETITFDPALRGNTLRPVTPLPTITRPVAVDGDLDHDGAPDLCLSGELLTAGHGLEVELPILAGPEDRAGAMPLGCAFTGLAVINFPGLGICITGGSDHRLASCHIGADLTGNTARANRDGGLYLANATHSLIGGTGPAGNVVVGGDSPGESGLRFYEVTASKVLGNYLGVTRDGARAFGGSKVGTGAVISKSGVGNQFGGAAAGERNLFGGLNIGLALQGEQKSVVQGNYFGLGQDGDTHLPINAYCVQVTAGSTGNLIGGETPEAGNVFTTDGTGIAVYIANPGTEGNSVQGNLFGSNAAGTAKRPLAWGVVVALEAGPQIIGGATAAAGNYFTPDRAEGAVSIQGSHGAVVRFNRIGFRRDGGASPVATGIEVRFAEAVVRDNIVAAAGVGLHVTGAGAQVKAAGNMFRECDKAVLVDVDGACDLGRDPEGAFSADTGCNTFRASNGCHIYNETASAVMAAGNSFDTTSRRAIEAKVHDQADEPVHGRVAFSPLAGGVIAADPPLSLSLAAAAPTGQGAEFAFNLSIPARVTVEVTNVAGRTVAFPVLEHSFEAGLQRVVWSRHTHTGTRAPAGLYLASVTAHTASGETAQALCRVALR